MRGMSVCLVCYNMCFVFIADNRRPLEGRKQQPLILCAGQAFLHSRAWSIRTPRAGSTGVVIHHSGHCIHTHTHLQTAASGHEAYQLPYYLPTHSRADTCTNRGKYLRSANRWPKRKQNEQMDSMRQFLHRERGQEKVGAGFSIKSFIKEPANQTLISMSQLCRGQ